MHLRNSMSRSARPTARGRTTSSGAMSSMGANKRRRLSTRQEKAKVHGLAAINRIRRGKSKSLSTAARAEGTTVRTIQRLLPAALLQNRPGGRIRVKAGDPYSARVRIWTPLGPLAVNARNSRERELAGRNRAIVMRVLQREEPASALEQFRNKTVGGQELISNFDQLSRPAQAGMFDQLEALYVSPETSM